MKIQALMRSAAVTSSSSTSESVRLEPVQTADENKSFSVGTPNIAITLEVNNPDAIGQFQQGENYVVSFSPATGAAKTATNATEAQRDLPNTGGRTDAARVQSSAATQTKESEMKTGPKPAPAKTESVKTTAPVKTGSAKTAAAKRS